MAYNNAGKLEFGVTAGGRPAEGWLNDVWQPSMPPSDWRAETLWMPAGLRNFTQAMMLEGGGNLMLFALDAAGLARYRTGGDGNWSDWMAVPMQGSDLPATPIAALSAVYNGNFVALVVLDAAGAFLSTSYVRLDR
jgi:hypothetical protein